VCCLKYLLRAWACPDAVCLSCNININWSCAGHTSNVTVGYKCTWHVISNVFLHLIRPKVVCSQACNAMLGLQMRVAGQVLHNAIDASQFDTKVYHKCLCKSVKALSCSKLTMHASTLHLHESPCRTKSLAETSACSISSYNFQHQYSTLPLLQDGPASSELPSSHFIL
jgi:hypothetical protein